MRDAFRLSSSVKYFWFLPMSISSGENGKSDKKVIKKYPS